MSVVPLSLFLTSLVHATATGDRFAALRHLAFIVASAVAGALSVAAMLVSLAVGGPRPLVEIGLFALLAGEIAIAAFLSRTGRLDMAQTLSALVLTSLIVGLSALSGGPRSTMVAWLAFVPLDATLAGSRRALIAAVAVAVCGFAGLFALARLGGYDEFARASSGDFAAFTVVMGLLLAASLALRMGGVVFGIAGMTEDDAKRDAAADETGAVAVTEPARLQAMIRRSMSDGPTGRGDGARRARPASGVVEPLAENKERRSA